MFTEKSIIIKRKISQTALFFILMLVLLAYDSYSQYNTAFGLNSLSSITTGTRNSAFGSSTLRLTTTGWYNSAFGLVALELNTTGSYNTALGTISLNNNWLHTNKTHTNQNISIIEIPKSVIIF